MTHVSHRRFCQNPECGLETWDEAEERLCPVCGTAMTIQPTEAQIEVARERGEIYYS